MRVKVVKARRSSYWYSSCIGQVFEVFDKIYLKRDGAPSYQLKDDYICLIDVADAVDVEKETVVFT